MPSASPATRAKVQPNLAKAKAVMPAIISRSATKAVKVPRKRKPPTYRTMRLSKRIHHPYKLASVWRLTRRSFRILWEHRRLFIGITLVYGLVNFVLAQGLGGTNVQLLKDELSQAFSGNLGSLTSSAVIFASLLSSAGNTSSQTAGAYQSFLAIMASLAIIWALRHVHAGSVIRIRDAFYRGMFPLVPFVLVLLVIALQLVPLAIGSGLYTVVINNGIAVFPIEKTLWGVLYALLGLLSFYMVSSSIFAVYIVTLPDMTPMKALRSARQLVLYRRWTVLRKVIFLPVLLIVVGAIIMLPIIIWATVLAQWIFFVLTMAALTVSHSYLYSLYRELLNE